MTVRYMTEDTAIRTAEERADWRDWNGINGDDWPSGVRDALAYTDDLPAPTDDRGADQTAGVHHYEREGDR
jgi:hypothetical protein